MTTLILGFLFSLSASAYDICVDGIYYNLLTEAKKAEVTSGDIKYSGEITIPNTITFKDKVLNVTSIGYSAFEDCSGLTAINIPNSVTSIGYSAFEYCRSLTAINIPNSVTSIEYQAFYGCSGLTSVTIPNSVTSIGYQAFYGCSGLASVTIPNSVTSIGGEAFEGCSSLTAVTIGNMVEDISTKAFAGCKNLENVYCYAEKLPFTKKDVFIDSYIEYATLYVPASAVDAYKTTEPWSGFGAFKIIGEMESKKCESPTIEYKDGELHFSCATEDVEYVSNIKCADVNTFYTSRVALTACYDIEVYATKNGYENSDKSTAKLYWLTSSGSLDVNSINSIAMRGIAVQTSDGFINISGLNDNERVSFFTIDGRYIGNATAFSGAVIFTAQPNSIVVAKIGKESIKIIVK